MGQSWGRRLPAVVPALVAGGALWLPWESSAGTVYVIDGPTLTGIGTGLENGFALLGPVRFVGVLLAMLATVVVAFVSVRGPRWVGAVSGVVVGVVAVAALVERGPAIGSVVALLAALVLLVAGARHLAGRRAFAAAGVVVLLAAGLVVTSGAAGFASGPVALLAGQDFGEDARLVPADGSVAVADGDEVVLAEHGESTRLATVDGGDVTVLGIVGHRFVYYRADAFELRIFPLAGGRPDVVTGVVDVDSMTTDGIVLFRTAGITTPTLRRLDVAKVSGTTAGDDFDAAPVPATRPLLETEDEDRPLRFQEHPGTGQVVAIDNTEMAVPDVVAAEPDAPRWHQLTDLLRGCPAPRLAVIGRMGVLAPDAVDGWWVTTPDTITHVRGDGYARRVPPDADLPIPSGMLTGADGMLYLLDGHALRRVPAPESLLREPAQARRCPPLPVVADPVRLDPVEPGDNLAVLPDGSGGDWRRYLNDLEHRDASGQLLSSVRVPADAQEAWPDLTGAVPYAGRCPPTRKVGDQTVTPAPIEGCWDALVIGRDGRGWGIVAGRLYSFGPAGVAELTHGGPSSTGEPVATLLASGTRPDVLPLAEASLALDATGTPLVLVDDVLLGVADQDVVVLGQDSRLRGARLFTRDDGVAVQTRDGMAHRLGY